MEATAPATTAEQTLLASRITYARRTFGDYVVAFRGRLLDWRFWVVQAMVAAVTFVHAALETLEASFGHDVGAVYFVPASLYFLPVVYASLNFGREGAIPTAVWSALLAVPNIVLWHHGLERVGEGFQMVMMIALATVIAGRVDKEIVARHHAEEEERARRVSEMKYRRLFDSAGEAILLIDADGMVEEANEAAAALFGRGLGEIRGIGLGKLVGTAGSEAVLAAAAEPDEPIDVMLQGPDGAEAWFQPVCSLLDADAGEGMVLALLRDVTERRGFQSYAREIVRAQEEERQRIAHELHDVSLQSIVLLCRKLDAVEESLAEMPEPLRAATAEARTRAEAIGDELRRFSRDLRPTVLDDLGLGPAIRHVVNEMSERSPTRGRLIVSGTPLRLTPSTELSVFRIAQEALRNVERHAQAQRVTVRLAYESDRLRLTISDNGRGFQVPPQASHLATSGRLGVLGMRERARLVGGTCEIASWPGKGTRIEVSVPCCEAEGEAGV